MLSACRDTRHHPQGTGLRGALLGRPVARVSGDIDVLVAPPHVAAAVAAFEVGADSAGVTTSRDWYEPRWHYHAVLAGRSRSACRSSFTGGSPDRAWPRSMWPGSSARRRPSAASPGISRRRPGVAAADRRPARDAAPVPAARAARRGADGAGAFSEAEWAIAVREARRAGVGPAVCTTRCSWRTPLRTSSCMARSPSSDHRARERIVLPFLDALPVSDFRIAPGCRWERWRYRLRRRRWAALPAGMARSLSDRPRVACWIDRPVVQRESRRHSAAIDAAAFAVPRGGAHPS